MSNDPSRRVAMWAGPPNVATALIAPPHVWPPPSGFGRTALVLALLLGPALGAGVGAWLASSEA